MLLLPLTQRHKTSCLVPLFFLFKLWQRRKMNPSTLRSLPRTDWMELFFSSNGRIKALQTIVCSLFLTVITSLYQAAIEGPARILTDWFVYPVIFFSAACVISKRLHDRGRSGWWSSVILLAIVLVWPAPVGFFDTLAVLFLIWAAVELFVMPSEKGHNRFGPPLP
jgi:uncharacterized membrane protein YhaH (DUF805 family)